MGRWGGFVRGAAAGLGAVACVFLVIVAVGHGMVQGSLWATVLATPAAIVAAVAAIWTLRGQPVPKVRYAGVPAVSGWVNRGELDEVVTALTGDGPGLVALTTGLFGAGGFGKTMLAARACHDKAVRRRFGGRIVWITVGRDVREAALAIRISETVRNLGGEGALFSGVEQAGHALAEALAVDKTLLVADDVWFADQLEPFLTAGQAGRLLVTTRRPRLLAGAGAQQIKVDTVTEEVARRLITRDLPAGVMADQWMRELLRLTGRWPLLLGLVNHRLAEDLRRGAAIDSAAADAVDRLRKAGPAALDLADLGNRESAVAATIDYSLDALEAADRDRFLELGIFAEDAEIPLAVIALLWQGTAGLSEDAAQLLCDQLDGLSLLSLAWTGRTKVAILHDVIRDFLVGRLGAARSAAAHAALVNAARTLTGPASADGPSLTADRLAAGTRWWRLPQTAGSGYLLPNLTYHLKAAGLESELDQLCCDLRFVAVRLRHAGPAAVDADLARSASPAAVRLRQAIGHSAHLLGPIEPAAALTTILTARLGGVPEAAAQLHALGTELHAWTAWPVWPLPDLPPPAVPRNPADWVSGAAVCPDGTWLATASSDKTARIWDADGTLRTTLNGHGGWVRAVAISPDGTWLATASDDKTARIWDTDGTLRTTLAGHTAGLTSVAISPDGLWLATASHDKTARIWDADGTPLTVLACESGLRSVAISPDGTWLATADGNTTQIWATDGTLRATLTGHADLVSAVAISPDGLWLATASHDKTARIWDADGTPRATLAGHTAGLTSVTISPDGAWLATAGGDKTARIWASAAAGADADAGSVAAIKVDAVIEDCAWFPVGTDILIAGSSGIYRFELNPGAGPLGRKPQLR